MTALELLSSEWTVDALPIEIDLNDLMLDLDPRWEEWVPPVEVAS